MPRTTLCLTALATTVLLAISASAAPAPTPQTVDMDALYSCLNNAQDSYDWCESDAPDPEFSTMCVTELQYNQAVCFCEWGGDCNYADGRKEKE